MAEDKEKKEKPKATLIKHNKSDQSSQKTERKKVVVVKKKSVKKKPVQVVAKKDEEEKKSTKKTSSEPKAADTRDTRKPSYRGDQSRNNDYPRRDSGNRYDGPPRNRPTDGRSSGSGPYRDNNRQGGSGRGQDQRYGDRNRAPYDPNRNRDGQRGNFRNDNYRQGGNQQNRPAGGYKPRTPDNRPGGYDNRRNNTGGGGGGYNKRPGGGSGGGFNKRPGGSGGGFNKRPGGGSGGGFNKRPGGGGGGGFNRPTEQNPAQDKKHGNKKFFKAKKKPNYNKSKKESLQEKDFHIKKKTVQRTNPVPKEIDIMEVITVSELARKMNLKASELISKLMGMGMMVTINQQIDAETAQILASEYKCEVKIVSLYDETIIESEKSNDEDLKNRPPIITVMGHVDHGKTKLLDAIRSTNVVDGEFGGITQHIGAYKVSVKDHELVFLDTPGHEAFTMMRARGAQVTDIVILVVAANDGVMPQTVEAIHHAKEADVPIIVAVNKIDLPEANPDKVKQQLADHGIMEESWGGTNLFCEISALKREGIQELLEMVLLQAEMLELKADFTCRAEGKVIESQVDHGRGIVSSVIIERGTLRVGDAFVAGIYPGKVRAMFDDKGKKLEIATPATPVEILGLTGVPNAGAPFQVTENEKIARQVGGKRQELEKQGEAKNVKKVTLDNLYDSIQDGDVKELKVIIKGDVHGSVEALQDSLTKLSTPEIKLSVIDSAAGAIVESDIYLASASNAIILGFHVRPTPKALALAEQEKVEIKKYNIIYDAVNDIHAAMEGMLSPDITEEIVGTVEVRDTFKVPKLGVIAGCYVLSGKVTRGGTIRVFRDGIEIHTGKITSLKRFKDDVKEVASNYECGIGIEDFADLKVGDQFEIIEMKEVAKKMARKE